MVDDRSNSSVRVEIEMKVWVSKRAAMRLAQLTFEGAGVPLGAEPSSLFVGTISRGRAVLGVETARGWIPIVVGGSVSAAGDGAGRATRAGTTSSSSSEETLSICMGSSHLACRLSFARRLSELIFSVSMTMWARQFGGPLSEGLEGSSSVLLSKGSSFWLVAAGPAARSLAFGRAMESYKGKEL